MKDPGWLGQDAAPSESLLEEIRIAILDTTCGSELDEESILFEVQLRQYE
jgi:hypothetical protein